MSHTTVGRVDYPVNHAGDESYRRPKRLRGQLASGVHRESETKPKPKLGIGKEKQKQAKRMATQQPTTDIHIIIKGRHEAYTRVVLHARFFVQQIQLHQDNAHI